VPLPGGDWADASTIVRVFRCWLVEPVETLDPATVDRLDVALRAVLDL
jgi:hypothetical protein